MLSDHPSLAALITHAKLGSLKVLVLNLSSLCAVTCSQGWGQVQLVKYSNTSSTLNQVQVQVLCIFTNQVLKYIKY